MISRRVARTSAPAIVRLSRLIQQDQHLRSCANRAPLLSLAQGVVHWPPPPTAAPCETTLPDHSYGPAFGSPLLVKKLQEIHASPHVMVTAGANQAFVNCVLALCDAQDRVVLFSPFYFNHEMACTMTGCEPLVLPREPPAWNLNLASLASALAGDRGKPRIRMVVVVNPDNPCGVVVSRQDLEAAARLCADHGAWLVVDNTYRDFVQSPHEHHVVAGDHVLNIFSFSKAYGMMGYRVGYLTWSNARLAEELAKIQDTIPICATQISQRIALGALRAGSQWVRQQVDGLSANRQVVRRALAEALGEDRVSGGAGAIYFLAQVPFLDDWRLCEELIADFGVATVPGSAFGRPGFLRVSYGNLPLDATREAAARLGHGLAHVTRHGLSACAGSPTPPPGPRGAPRF